MNPANFTWREVEPGVEVKELGTFTECKTRLAMLRVTNTSYRMSASDQTALLFVTHGMGMADGRAIGERDGILIEPPGEGVISSMGELEMFLLGLPKLSKMAMSASDLDPLLTHV